MKEKLYVIYDMRAELGNTDDASILGTENSYEEAKKTLKNLGEGVVYSYREEGQNLVDEEYEFNYLIDEK